MKSKECIFKTNSGNELIIRYRKSVVFFERQADLSNTEQKKIILSWRNGPVVYGDEKPHFKREEISRKYTFPPTVFLTFVEQLQDIGKEAWANFEPKIADSMGADYDSYWDT